MALVDKPQAQQRTGAKDDVRWVSSACSLCYSQCTIKAKVVNGVVMKIEGNPDSPLGSGHLCPKGVAGIMTLYDPNRVNVPLKRTNPKKGFGEDPGWKEISWDEAMDIITARLKKIRAENPKKLVLQRTTTSPNTARTGLVWMSAFGSPNQWPAGGGLHCGNGAHLLNGMFHASWSMHPDYTYGEYAIYFGASKGHSAGHSANPLAGQAAEARARGMKLTVVDPMCNFAGGKSTDWVPIRVGTDAALALGMVNLLLNEFGIYDTEYLQTHTNAPYLIGADSKYVRDPETKKPLVWDAAEGKAKTYDDPTVQIKDMAILGTYEVNGVKAQTGFQKIKDHVKKYTPEKVESITTVSPATVRRLAREFGEHARVGSTIEIDGHKLPYRPVSATYFRGAQGHKNSTWNCLAIELLNQIVGASDVPGGALGFSPVMHGHPETGRPYFEPYEGPDGLMITGAWLAPHKPYPITDPPEQPNQLTLVNSWPLTMCTGFLGSKDQEEIWSQLGVDYRPEMMINFGANSILSVGNPATVAEALKKYDFIVSFDLFITEFSEFADIVLPDTSYLERLDTAPQYPPLLNHPGGTGDWGWPIRQPVIQPEFQRRNFQEVMLELAYRVGFGDEFHAMMNLIFPIKEKWALQPGEKYSWEEISDRRLRTMFGDKYNLDWFKENGLMRWKKTVKEIYWRPFVKCRVPIYFEMIKPIGEKQKAVFDKFEFSKHFDWNRWDPLPEWAPCNSHACTDPQYDMYGFYYRDVLHTNSFTYENPWLDEAAQMSPFSYAIAINDKVAAKKGLKSGDHVIVESQKGKKVQGRVMLTDTIHPEHIAVGGCAGHFTKYQPIALGKGVRFNELLEVELDNMDPTNLNLDTCVKIKVYKDPNPPKQH